MSGGRVVKKKKKNATTGTRKDDLQSKQQPIYNTQHNKISIGSSVINQGQPFRGFNNDMVINLGSPRYGTTRR